MIGRRPEPVPGVEPGRWRVVRVRGVEGSAMDWYVDRENCHGSMWFPTWRDAMEAADRMARTREVVLPRRTVRPTSRHMVLENGLIIELEHSPDFPELPPKYLTVKPEERRPLALALLALAEMENA